MNLKIAPSILSADFGRLNEEIAAIDPYVDLIHVDVMDGHFVQNITIGPAVVRHIKSAHPLDVHLMISEPEKYVEAFAKAGAGSLTVHEEASRDLPALIAKIKSLGVKAAVSVKPGTDVRVLDNILNDLDMVLVMTVEPGFGGQEFMPEMLEKVRYLRAKRPDIDIEVDGGINAETARDAVVAGANVLVAGHYIFSAEDRTLAIKSLRG